MNNRYESIKQVLISILRVTYNIIKFIATAIWSIIVFLLKVLFAIIGLLFKTSKPIIAEAFESDDNVWITDDTNFAYAFQTGCPDPTCKEGQMYYMHGPIFFSKQFKKSDHQRIQNKCKKNWNQYLRWVSDARMFKRINW